MNLYIYMQCHIETVFGHIPFYKLVSRWFNDTQNPPMMEGEFKK